MSIPMPKAHVATTHSRAPRWLGLGFGLGFGLGLGLGQLDLNL